MKIGVIIPDRNDRPKLLANCLRMLKAQTLQPEIIELVNDPAITSECDITWRYRTGYERLRNKNIDLIAFIENDDWYATDYLETMANEWVNHGRPNLFGTDYTIYYHLKLFSHFTMYHDERSSAMSTLILPDMNIKWCNDNEPYTDMHLWHYVKGKVFRPQKHICLGMKHGDGKCGGYAHTNRFDRYVNHDTDKALLKRTLDEDSYNFYSNYLIQ